jgi:hypothetical protein
MYSDGHLCDITQTCKRKTVLLPTRLGIPEQLPPLYFMFAKMKAEQISVTTFCTTSLSEILPQPSHFSLDAGGSMFL